MSLPGLLHAVVLCVVRLVNLIHTCSVVETSTTVVCPYATVSTQSGGVVTSVIETTTYVSFPATILSQNAHCR